MPVARELARLSSELGAFVFKPIVIEASIQERTLTMKNCVRLASLLDTAAILNSLRAQILRPLSILAIFLPSTAPFRYYNPTNTYYTRSAAYLLTKLYPDSNYMVGMAFALVMNPVISSDVYKDSPPPYFSENHSAKPLIEV